MSVPTPIDPARMAPAARARAGAFQDAAAALRARWWLVALGAVAAMAAAWLATARQTPVYRATATLVVAPSSSIEDPADIVRTLETLDRRSVIATFARIPGSAEARAATAARLAVTDGLRGWRIEGSVLPSTNILRIDAEGPDAARAADVANAAAEVTAHEARSLYRIFTLRPMARAVAPSGPSEPDLRRNLLVAAAVGLLLGALAAVGLRFRAPARG